MLSDHDLADIESFVNDVRLPVDATVHERLLHQAAVSSLRDLVDEVKSLRREKAHLVAAAKSAAIVVNGGNVALSPGLTVGFLFVNGGRAEVEAISKFSLDDDTPLDIPAQADEVRIGQIVTALNCPPSAEARPRPAIPPPDG